MQQTALAPGTGTIFSLRHCVHIIHCLLPSHSPIHRYLPAGARLITRATEKYGCSGLLPGIQVCRPLQVITLISAAVVTARDNHRMPTWLHRSLIVPVIILSRLRSTIISAREELPLRPFHTVLTEERTGQRYRAGPPVLQTLLHSARPLPASQTRPRLNSGGIIQEPTVTGGLLMMSP